MSNSVRPHRRQPTRLPRPWDSPALPPTWVNPCFLAVSSFGQFEVNLFPTRLLKETTGDLCIVENRTAVSEFEIRLANWEWAVLQKGRMGILNHRLGCGGQEPTHPGLLAHQSKSFLYTFMQPKFWSKDLLQGLPWWGQSKMCNYKLRLSWLSKGNGCSGQ